MRSADADDASQPDPTRRRAPVRACWVAWICGPLIWSCTVATMLVLRVNGLDTHAETKASTIVAVLSLAAFSPLVMHSIAAIVTMYLLLLPGAHRRWAAPWLLALYCILQLTMFALVWNEAVTEMRMFNFGLVAGLLALAIPFTLRRS